MTDTTTSYTDFLPPFLQGNELLAGLLSGFERILTQEATADPDAALETKIIESDRYIRPVATTKDPDYHAPEEFLPWLANWVAVALRDDWDVDAKRAFIREAVGLYRYRGTKFGMAEMLRIYLGVSDDATNLVTIFDSPADFGFDPPPHYFQVQITVTASEQSQLRRIQRIAEAIIEQEKPAHTYFGLSFLTPTMQLNSFESKRTVLVVGENMLLGTATVAVE